MGLLHNEMVSGSKCLEIHFYEREPKLVIFGHAKQQATHDKVADRQVHEEKMSQSLPLPDVKTRTAPQPM
jgi:hypothetical protein